MGIIIKMKSFLDMAKTLTAFSERLNFKHKLVIRMEDAGLLLEIHTIAQDHKKEKKELVTFTRTFSWKEMNNDEDMRVPIDTFIRDANFKYGEALKRLNNDK